MSERSRLDTALAFLDEAIDELEKDKEKSKKKSYISQPQEIGDEVSDL